MVYIPSSVAEKLLGKGILAQNVQLCARFNGGANAGHTLTLDAKWGRGARVEGFPETVGMVPKSTVQNVESKMDMGTAKHCLRLKDFKNHRLTGDA